MEYHLITGEKFFNVNKILCEIAPSQKGVILCDKVSYLKLGFQLSNYLKDNFVKIVTIIVENNTLSVDNLKNLSLLPEDTRFIISVGESVKYIASYLASINNLPHLNLVLSLPLNLYPKSKIIIRDQNRFYRFICDSLTYVFIDLREMVIGENFIKDLFCYFVDKIFWLKEYQLLTGSNLSEIINSLTLLVEDIDKGKIDLVKLATTYLWAESKILQLDRGEVYSADFLCMLNKEFSPTVEQYFISTLNLLRYINTPDSEPPNYNERAKTVAFILGIDQNIVIENMLMQLKSINRPVKSLSIDKAFIKKVNATYIAIGGKKVGFDQKTYLSGDSPFNINAMTLFREV